jgi:SAM-dependent methyltransferase
VKFPPRGVAVEGVCRLFTRLSVRYYDALYAAKGKDYADEAGRLHKYIQQYKRCASNALLDVACGTGGRLPFLRPLYEVEALDMDTDMLEEARRKCPDAVFHRADMTDFRLGRSFGVVVCLFCSLPYVKTVPRLRQAVQTMGSHVERGGLVIIEPWFNQNTFRAGSVHGVYVDQPDLKIARINRGAIEDGIAVVNFHYLVGTPDGVRHFSERHELGLFSHDDYLAAFQSAGLDVTYDDEGLTGLGLYIGLRGEH